MHIIPHLETVANVAYYKESTSNIILTLFGNIILSPLGNVRILLSSKTEFRFSTHSGSISPSKIIQCYLFISPFSF